MSEQNSFANGFLIGTIVGGVLGGVIGTLLTTKNNNIPEPNEDESLLNSQKKSSLNYNESIHDTRLSLEEKINQLNHAIDDVRVTLLKNTDHHDKEIVQE